MQHEPDTPVTYEWISPETFEALRKRSTQVVKQVPGGHIYTVCGFRIGTVTAGTVPLARVAS